jgi:hypothetical protein
MHFLRRTDGSVPNTIIWLLRVSVLPVLVYTLALGLWTDFFLSALALILTFVPTLLERQYDVDLPVELEFVIVLFMYASIFLGEFGNAYETFWWWDLVLHISSGIILAFAAFLILYVMYYRHELKMSPRLIALFLFALTVTAGVVWEFFEFAMDELFGLEMQKGLRDTMGDLLVDALGALPVAWIAAQHFKNGSSAWISFFFARFIRLNPRLNRD